MLVTLVVRVDVDQYEQANSRQEAQCSKSVFKWHRSPHQVSRAST